LELPVGCVSSRAVDYQLSPAEARILGCLIEKEITTPEYYPLSLNALTNACNQRSNREPVMTLDEHAVRTALRSLTDQFLARSAGTDGRVAKFEHRLQEVFNLHRHEVALLCVLLLRGPQTPGELRTRAERMYTFDDLESLHSSLNLLMKRKPPLAALLPRRPGTKEARYKELLSASLDERASLESDTYTGSPQTAMNTDSSRFERLESEIADLRQQILALRKQLEALQTTPD
jgi:uncharacterized protein YceH (UPF0502 family)